MDRSYSIDEILLAVNEIQNKKKKKKVIIHKNKPVSKDYSKVPIDTLRLIEEAEKLKN